LGVEESQEGDWVAKMPATGRFIATIIQLSGFIGTAFDVVAKFAHILTESGRSVAGRQDEQPQRGEGEKNEGFHGVRLVWI
jgi:hypothetical protein